MRHRSKKEGERGGDTELALINSIPWNEPTTVAQPERVIQASIISLPTCMLVGFSAHIYSSPLGQLSGSTVAALLQAVPAGQGRQTLAPGIGLNVPGSQGSSTPVPAGQ